MSIPSIVTTGSIALRNTCARRIRDAARALRARGAHVVLAELSRARSRGSSARRAPRTGTRRSATAGTCGTPSTSGRRTAGAFRMVDQVAVAADGETRAALSRRRTRGSARARPGAPRSRSARTASVRCPAASAAATPRAGRSGPRSAARAASPPMTSDAVTGSAAGSVGDRVARAHRVAEVAADDVARRSARTPRGTSHDAELGLKARREALLVSLRVARVAPGARRTRRT